MKSKVSKTNKTSKTTKAIKATSTNKTKKKELIDFAVLALNQANHQMGYHVISKQTLQKIMDEYIRKYDPPAKPCTTTIVLGELD
jgi:chemotaxis protein histidine kinase CheA